VESTPGSFWRVVGNRKQVKTIDDIEILNLKSFSDVDGALVSLESNNQIPFVIKRIFYVHGVKNQQTRGQHAHYETQQVLICIKGACQIICSDGKSSWEHLLKTPTQAVYIPEMIWDEQIYMSEDTILLVLSNTLYDKKDYINDYSEFKRLKRNI